MRKGILTREVEWRSPTGGAVRVRSTRLVSFTQRSVAAIRYEVEPLEGPLRVVVQSELVSNEPVPVMTKDPRAAAALAAPLEAEEHSTHDLRAVLVHITRRSRLRMGAGMDHIIDGPEGTVTQTEAHDDLGRVTITADIAPGEPLRVDKLLAYGWSSVRSLPSVRDQVDAALAAARKSGFDGLAKEQRSYLDDFWSRADIELDGDLELQQAVRFCVFSVLQAGARAEQRAIPAKGLSGPGYDGHTFWDSEAFVLPLLTYTAPDAAADALRWRWSTLDLAVERAHTLHLEGRGVPVAHHPRAGVLGLLARRHGRLPHQRGHRGGGRALRGSHRRRGLRAHGRARAAGPHRPAVALARPPRHGGRVPHRRRHRA